MDYNTKALHDHEKQVDADERFNEAVEAEANKLLDGDYSPFLPENIAEALCQNPEFLVKLSEQIKQDTYDFNEIGRLVQMQVVDYWNHSADQEAIRIVEERQNRGFEP
jgi:DNA integrity scanning protein DisA with diadenylate cyclase activity